MLSIYSMKRLKLFDNKVCVYFLLILPVIWVYYPIVSNDFLYFWDDQWVVINPYTTAGLTFDNLYRILTEFYHGQYAPVNELSYVLLYTAFGYNPVAFHLMSLVWHVANVLLVYLFISKLLVLRGGFPKENVLCISFLTALVFGVHPVNVESVAWVSASKVLIYSFFYLLALLSYLKYVEDKKIRYYCLTFLFFIFSFGGKEQAVTLPVCLLLIDYFVNRNLKDKQVWIEKIPFFLFALFFGLLTIQSQGDPGNRPVYPVLQRLVLACYTLFEYFVKCFIPVKLSYLYPFPMQPGEPLPARFWLYPFIISGSLLYLYSNRKNAVLIFSVLFFVVHVGVALHLISLSRFAIVADRYVYVACIGFAFLLSYLFVSFYEKLKNRKAMYIVLVSMFIYVVYLGTYTYRYSKQWKDSNTLKANLRELIQSRKDIKDHPLFNQEDMNND